MKYAAPIIMAFSILFLTVGCSKQKKYKKVTYQGTLLENAGGKPLEGYNVYLWADCPDYRITSSASFGTEHCVSFEVGRTTTDSSGNFKIEEKAARTDNYYVTIRDPNNNKELYFKNVNAKDLQSEKLTKLFFN